MMNLLFFSIVGPADGVAETGTAEFMVIAKDNTGRIIDPGAEIEIFYTVTDDPNGNFIAMEDEGSNQYRSTQLVLPRSSLAISILHQYEFRLMMI